MRKPMIAGNWKMNKTPAETKALIEDLRKLENRSGAEVVVCPMTVSRRTERPLCRKRRLHRRMQRRLPEGAGR